jgi:hypothetical protein
MFYSAVCFLFLKILKINEAFIINAGIIKTSLTVFTPKTSYCKNIIERKIIIVEIINPVFM